MLHTHVLLSYLVAAFVLYITVYIPSPITTTKYYVLVCTSVVADRILVGWSYQVTYSVYMLYKKPLARSSLKFGMWCVFEVGLS